MEKAIDIARYFISIDTNNQLFNKSLITRNDRKFYEGNARLNKYLQLAQNLYIAKTGGKLFQEDMYAYDNGAVVPEVQENYAVLLSKKKESHLSEEICIFLRKVYDLLRNASVDELIELSHEDDAWINKHLYYYRNEQKMDSLSYADKYKEQYEDVLRIMESMSV